MKDLKDVRSVVEKHALLGIQLFGSYVKNAFLSQKYLIQRRRPLQHGTGECRKMQKARREEGRWKSVFLNAAERHGQDLK